METIWNPYFCGSKFVGVVTAKARVEGAVKTTSNFHQKMGVCCNGTRLVSDLSKKPKKTEEFINSNWKPYARLG